MTELFLDDCRVYISSTEKIKLIRENTFLTLAGDYTLEVSIPLCILENRDFFGAWHRLEKRKKPKRYDARLYVANVCVLNGSAKVTNITKEAVKLQLYGDRSEFNAVFGDVYIDTLKLPYVKGHSLNFSGPRTRAGSFDGWRGDTPATGEDNTDTNCLPDTEEGVGKFVYVPIYNETADSITNLHTAVKRISGAEEPGIIKETPQWNLVYVIKCVFSAIGYKLDISEYDIEPFNKLMIASCSKATTMTSALPHWTLKEFVTQLQNFFGCVFIFSSSSLQVKMTDMANTTDISVTTIEAAEDFTVDVDEDGTLENLRTSDLHYEISDSAYHNNDYISQDKYDTLPIKEYDTLEELKAAYQAMSASEKGSCLLTCPEGDYCQWIYQGTKDTSTVISGLVHVNQFGDLVRNKQEEEEETENVVSIKIVPVAIAEDVEVPLYYENSSGSGNRGNIFGIDTQYMIAKSNNVCHEIMPSMPGFEYRSGSGSFGGTSNEVTLDTSAIQDLIGGDYESTSEGKPDRMEVFFYDGATQKPTQYEYSGTEVNVNVPAVFTAYDSKNLKGITHRKWSLAFRKSSEAVTMARVHKGLSVIQTQKYHVKFVAEKIPTATGIFIINNKRFYAEKIEAEIADGKLNKLMDGYFYEIEG